METIFYNSFDEILATVIAITILLISKNIISYIKAKKESFSGTDFYDTISAASDLVCQVVDSVSQTYVDDLKAEGKFDIESQKEATEQAMEKVKSLLSENSKKVITEAYNDLDAWIDTKIQAYIKSTKTSK